MKALGRGISAPPGLRSFSFRVGPPPAAAMGSGEQQQGGKQPAGAAALADGCRQDAEGQEQRQPNVSVPPQTPQQQQEAPQQAQILPLLVRASNGEWRSSGSTSSSGSVDFSTAAPEPRRWAFALLQPAPGLVSALCIEHDASASASSNGSCGSAGEQAAEGLRLLCFEAEPGSDEGQLVCPQLLAVGKYP